MKIPILLFTILFIVLNIGGQKSSIGHEEKYTKVAENHHIKNILKAYAILKKSYRDMHTGDITAEENKKSKRKAIDILESTLKVNTIIKSTDTCLFKQFHKTVDNAFTLTCTGEKRIFEDTGILFIIFKNTASKVPKKNITERTLVEKIKRYKVFSGSIKIIKVKKTIAANYGGQFFNTFTATQQSLRIYCKLLSID